MAMPSKPHSHILNPNLHSSFLVNWFSKGSSSSIIKEQIFFVMPDGSIHFLLRDFENGKMCA